MYSLRMRTAITTILLVLLPASAGADTASCYAIGNADARAYCLARERREPSQCYAIQSSDLRARCLAEVRR